MDDTVTRNRIGAMTYLAPHGALNNDIALAGLQGAAAACIAAHQVRVVLDLTKVTLINSKALEAMLDLHTKLTTFGGELKIAYPNILLQDVFRATGFSDRVVMMDAIEKEPSNLGPMVGRKKKLGDILLERELIDIDKIKEAAVLQMQSGKRIGQILVEKGWLPEVDLLKTLGEQLGVPYIGLRPGLYDDAAIALVSKETARRLEVLPMFKIKGVLTLATGDPHSMPSFDEVEKRTGCKVRLVLSRRADILANQVDAYSGGDAIPEFVENVADDFELIENLLPEDHSLIDEMAERSPLINMVNAIIQRAIRDQASDIHIEPSRGRSRIRVRIDGVLYEVMTPRHELHPAIVSRLKVMANLDIAERRLPQDGRIQVATQGRTVDLRFSSLPGIYGEKVVLRVLDKNQSILDLEKLGLSDDNLSRFKLLLARSHGLILATGPTGSGKTTTLYAAVNHLRSMENNVVTIEDPVEYQLDIINQNQVNDAIGLSFPKLLRHVLRQDPDIIMVGEIRDRQTAEIAVQSALTGHLVLSTLHTNGALDAALRLIEMGVEPYLLSAALIGVVAQRLVRRVCSECKTTYLVAPEVAAAHGWREANIRLSKGRGCPACYDSGYKGRLAIHEVLEIDDRLRKLMISSPNREDLEGGIHQHGYKTLYSDGMDRALKGITTLEEVARVIHAQ